MEEIVSEIEKINMDVVVLIETKKKGDGTEMIRKYVHLFSGVGKDQRAKREISILLKKKFKRKISDWEPINENMIKVNIQQFGRKITVLGVTHPQMINPWQLKRNSLRN